MTDIYGKYAHDLRRKGYSPLPLPVGKKFPPPEGWTGELAPMASGPDVQYWTEEQPEANIAIRLPDGVIGIDVDQYGEKTGADSVRAAIEKFGPLPKLGRLTSRPVGPSGIRFFRVPTGTKLASTFLAAGLGPDVEIIQHHHRYAVGPGSIHPDTKQAYRWLTANAGDEFPHVAELPILPQAWIDGLQPKKREPREEIPHDAWDEMDEGTKSRVTAYLETALAAIWGQLDEMKAWPKDYRGEYGGWEDSVLAITASLASLVKADWNPLQEEGVLTVLESHLPTDAKFTLGNGISKFLRGVRGDDIEARPFPIEPEFEWWTPGTYRQVGFREADGSGEAPPAEPVIVADNPDDWPRQSWNEEGNVARGHRWAAGSLRWLKDEETWVTYDQIRWVRDKTAGAYAVQQGMKAARWTELGNYDDRPQLGDDGQPKPNSSERDKFVAKMSDMSTSVMFDRAARSLALSGEVTSLSTDFDRDPMALGVLNGVVDLRTGELSPPAAEAMISHIAPVEYKPDAEAPRFMQYLEESLPDADVRAYLQRSVGYSITGLTIEQVMFLHHGKTSNGKSVLMDVLGALLGEYSGGADPKALIETRNEQHSTHIASLAGPRFLMMSETARGARLSDTLIKNITGGDIVTARKLYKENEDLKIIGKIHMVTNHLPHIVASPSTNRRIQLINWPVEIAEDKIDLQLARKIIATELEGVLAWVIRGAAEWWATLQDSQGRPVRRGGRPSGLAMPEQVIVDTANYLRSEDDILEWLEERTQPSESLESTGNLYQDYRSWAERRGVRNIMTLRAFSTDLEVRGELKRGRSKTIKGFVVALQPLQQGYFTG